MPARRRAQEAKRRAQRIQRLAEQRVVYVQPVEAEIDREWAEHQHWERFRRAEAADPFTQARQQAEREQRQARIHRDLERALGVVEADFARWARGDFSP